MLGFMPAATLTHYPGSVLQPRELGIGYHGIRSSVVIGRHGANTVFSTVDGF